MSKVRSGVIILGAGPAGLTAAYLLSKEGIPVEVLEAGPVYVGGISRTVRYKGFHFDIGGHRFFSKSKEVEDLWTEILGNDLLNRPRSSRIFYNGKFFSYPLKAFDALGKLGIYGIHALYGVLPVGADPSTCAIQNRLRSGSAIVSASGCFVFFSRPIPKRCGV